MKHLQKYIVKKPIKKMTRRIMVKMMVIGGDACGSVAGATVATSVVIGRRSKIPAGVLFRIRKRWETT